MKYLIVLLIVLSNDIQILDTVDTNEIKQLDEVTEVVSI